MKRPGPNYRYIQKSGERLPRLSLAVEVVPMAEGNKPVGFSVKDGHQVIGTLTLKELAEAMARYEKGLLDMAAV
jgi:hypothetical protein